MGGGIAGRGGARRIRGPGGQWVQHRHVRARGRILTAMPVQHAIWRMGAQATLLSVGSLANENELEELICAEPAILTDRWLLIGRQVPTNGNGDESRRTARHSEPFSESRSTG